MFCSEAPTQKTGLYQILATFRMLTNHPHVDDWSYSLQTGLIPKLSQCLLLAVWILYSKWWTLRRSRSEANLRQTDRQTDIPEYWKMVGWWGLHAEPWWAPGGWHGVWRWNIVDWDPHGAWGPSSGAGDELPRTDWSGGVVEKLISASFTSSLLLPPFPYAFPPLLSLPSLSPPSQFFFLLLPSLPSLYSSFLYSGDAITFAMM